MQALEGKAAVVTGGASGIGLALARAFAEAGMRVVLTDIEKKSLDEAVDNLRRAHQGIHGIICDVSDRAAVERMAEEAIGTLGRVHVVCNNAGIGAGGPLEQVPLDDWEWVLGVNLMGVVYGIRAFVPHMKAHGEGGHIVNTASMAGMASMPMMGPYSATKHAVVSLSETLAAELAVNGIGVSVLCPGWVNTRIADSGRNRPTRFGAAAAPDPVAGAVQSQVAALLRTGMDPAEVAARVLAAIRDNDLFVFTATEMRPVIEDRFRRILAAYDKAAAFKR